MVVVEDVDVVVVDVVAGLVVVEPTVAIVVAVEAVAVSVNEGSLVTATAASAVGVCGSLRGNHSATITTRAVAAIPAKTIRRSNREPPLADNTPPR